MKKTLTDNNSLYFYAFNLNVYTFQHFDNMNLKLMQLSKSMHLVY